jgi:hypothetical protein
VGSEDLARVVSVLEEIRDDQRLQLQRQAEALALQREQFAMVQKQFERTEHIQERAEMLQTRSAQIVGTARKVMIVVLPIITFLIIYLSWLLFRR